MVRSALANYPTKTGPDGPAFRIRRARRGDAEAIGNLLKELGYPLGSDMQTTNWVISHPEIEIFVASDSLDKPVGMVTLSHRPQLRLRGRIGTVDELVVTESWRKKGVGRALLQTVVERARALSMKRLEIVSHVARLDTATGFYASCGFVEADAMVLRHAEVESRRT
ncbi:GNAT family N-acetyltransferase [Aggregicoccus sp. 17bor-14]|nr:GNAT family N-acetyltransferase [Simulacricoccus sp. 17bor-14]MRI91335.1 GNAT family N-acetyltransferase [Aggregicoccus sp. 17bor-14]